MKGAIAEQDGREYIVHQANEADLKAVAETCKRLHIEGFHGDKEMRHLAEFPGYIIQAYCDVNGILWSDWFNNPEHARRMMKDPALSDFLIWNGGRA